MPGDESHVLSFEPRKKRAKIMSACGECRRKKTKCNGELPCRSCAKSSVACVYPAVGNLDERRSVPSKAALEAIEERLKSIEDMLKAIIHSRQLALDLDPVMVDNFLNGKRPLSSSMTPSPRPSTLAMADPCPSVAPSVHPSPTVSPPPYPYPQKHVNPPPRPPSQPPQPPQPALASSLTSQTQQPIATVPLYDSPPHRDHMLPPIQSLSVSSPAYDRLPPTHDRHRSYHGGFQLFRHHSQMHEAQPDEGPHPKRLRQEDAPPDDTTEYTLEPIQQRK